MKRFFALILCTALLAGCAGTSLPTDSAGENVQQIQYDWMAGESPVSPERTGSFNNSIGQLQNQFECTATGSYWMCRGIMLYCDHDSDEVIRLCGRPDCAHKDMTCNAHFSSDAYNVCYHDGYLYVARNTTLIQCKPDGTNREILMDAAELTGRGSYGIRSPQIWNGIFSIGLKTLDDNGEITTDCFYASLDNDDFAMQSTQAFLPIQTDNDQFIVQADADSGLYRWDPDTGEMTFLTQPFGRHYYGADEAWFIENGVINKLEYDVGEPEVILDTRISDANELYAYPDCLIIASYSDNDSRPPSLYFYNWAFESLGSVTLNYPGSTKAASIPICGETPTRFYLCDNIDYVPRYYINKADLGSGKITLHKLTIPEDIREKLEADGTVWGLY